MIKPAVLRAWLDEAKHRHGITDANPKAEAALIKGLCKDISNLHKPPGIKATLIRPGG